MVGYILGVLMFLFSSKRLGDYTKYLNLKINRFKIHSFCFNINQDIGEKHIPLVFSLKQINTVFLLTNKKKKKNVWI